MSCRILPGVKTAVLLGTALVLAVPQAMAGGVALGNGGASRPAQSSHAPQPAAVTVVRPVSVSIVASPAPTAKAPAFVDLRGPNGEVRRFAVEGGAGAIESREVVLRPGQSISIRWVATK